MTDYKDRDVGGDKEKKKKKKKRGEKRERVMESHGNRKIYKREGVDYESRPAVNVMVEVVVCWKKERRIEKSVCVWGKGGNRFKAKSEMRKDKEMRRTKK